MKIFGDYHTHTTYSHGKGDVLSNALKAKEMGLEEIGISDHGFAHPLYGLKKENISAMKNDCVMAEAQTGVRVLLGLESNIVSSKGECDLTEDLYSEFDIFLAGVHVFVNYKDISSRWNLGVYCPFVSSIGAKASEKVRSFVTDAYIKAVKTQPIDILTHLDFRVFSNVKEVADCCREYGTYIEINTKKSHMSDEQWREVSSTGVSFVIGSDAHSPERVADFKSAFELMERVGIDESRVHNLNRRPDFRFAKYKGVKI